MSVPFVTIKLDKPRDIRFANSRLLQAEAATGKTVHEMIWRTSAADAVKLLNIGLLWQDKDMTEKQVLEIIDEHVESFQVVMDAVYKALSYALYGKDKTEAIEKLMQGQGDQGKNG